MASTIKDVAKLAGVSPSTISGVLNKQITVRPETLERIHEAIAKTHYSPNAVARGLRKRETKTLGLLLPTITNPYYPLIARGAEEEAHENGYHMFLCTTQRSEKRRSDYIRSAVTKSMDGLILCNLGISPQDIELLHSEMIAVAVSRPVEAPYIDVVEIDHFGAAREMTNYLISMGHRRIALINGFGSYRSEERRRGFLTAFAENGLTPDESLIVAGEFSMDYAYQCANRLLDLPMPPTCFFSTGNMMLAVINAVRDRGLRVPEDISVASSDNSLSIACPSMTTVDYHGFEFGRQLAKMVISRRKAYLETEKRTMLISQQLIPGKTVLPVS